MVLHWILPSMVARGRERKGLVDVVLIEFLLQLPLLAAS